MPFANGVFTRLRRWVGEPNISAVEFDADGDDVALALSTALLRDGTGVPTADTPWNGHKITGLAAPVNTGDALALGFTPSAEVTRALGYTPALPSNAFNAAGQAQSDMGTNQKTYFLNCNFVATASNLLAIGAASAQNNTAGSGVITAYVGVDLIDNTTGSIVTGGSEAPVGCNALGGPCHAAALLIATGLVVGRSYAVRLYAYKNQTGGVIASSNIFIDGISF